MAKPPLISVTIKEPEKIIFEGDAVSVTSVSSHGKFDVLAYHANFIALIQETIVIGLDGKPPMKFPIKTGVMKVSKNTVKIILGIETKATTTK